MPIYGCWAARVLCWGTMMRWWVVDGQFGEWDVEPACANYGALQCSVHPSAVKACLGHRAHRDSAMLR